MRNSSSITEEEGVLIHSVVCSDTVDVAVGSCLNRKGQDRSGLNHPHYELNLGWFAAIWEDCSTVTARLDSKNRSRQYASTIYNFLHEDSHPGKYTVNSLPNYITRTFYAR